MQIPPCHMPSEEELTQFEKADREARINREEAKAIELDQKIEAIRAESGSVELSRRQGGGWTIKVYGPDPGTIIAQIWAIDLRGRAEYETGVES